MPARTSLGARVVMAYSLVIPGAALVILSVMGFFSDEALDGPNYCGTPLEFPVCTQLSNQSGEFLALIVVGIGIVVVGLYLGSRFGRERRSGRTARRQE